MNSSPNAESFNTTVQEPVKIIHKDQEQISAFCLNAINSGFIALVTPKEIQEMDISLLLDSPNWMEDECELDIMNLNKDIDTVPASSFLLIQTPNDNKYSQSYYHFPVVIVYLFLLLLFLQKCVAAKR
jgi:hypothetical protein